MLRKAFFAVIGFVVLMTALACWFIRSSFFSNYLKQQLIEAATKQQLIVSIHEFNTFLIGGRAQALSVFVPRAYSNFELSEVELLLHGFFQPWLESNARAYRGTLSARVHPRLDNQIELQFLAKDIALADHPNLKLLGIQSGQLTLDVPSLWASNGAILNGQGSLRLRDFSSRERSLPPLLTGLPVTLNIPKIRDGTIDLSCKYARNELACSKVEIHSTLFDADAVIDSLRFAQTEIQASLTLSAKGDFKAMLGQAVAIGCSQGMLACPVNQNPDASRFEFSLSGNLRKLKLTLLEPAL